MRRENKCNSEVLITIILELKQWTGLSLISLTWGKKRWKGRYLVPRQTAGYAQY